MVTPRSGLQGRQRGIAYMALMVFVAVMGITAAYSVRAGRALSQYDAEEQLLNIGLDFQQALHSYANASPAGAPRAPKTLDDLLKDPRYASTLRHLRRVPVDPMTGQADWALMRDPTGAIVALHSASTEKPQKVQGFDSALAHLEKNDKLASYADWLFIGPLAVPTR